MHLRTSDLTIAQPLAWLSLALVVLALTTPRAAHAHSGQQAAALITGAALGYALHDVYGRDRAYFVHGAHRHPGWRGCRARHHFQFAGDHRHLQRSYYRAHYYDDYRGGRGARKAQRKAQRKAHRKYHRLRGY